MLSLASMISIVNSPLQCAVAEFNRLASADHRDRLGLAEWCCSPNYRLCADDERPGMSHQRVNFAQGYGLRKALNVQRAKEEMIQKRTRRMDLLRMHRVVRLHHRYLPSQQCSSPLCLREGTAETAANHAPGRERSQRDHRGGV